MNDANPKVVHPTGIFGILGCWFLVGIFSSLIWEYIIAHLGSKREPDGNVFVLCMFAQVVSLVAILLRRSSRPEFPRSLSLVAFIAVLTPAAVLVVLLLLVAIF